MGAAPTSYRLSRAQLVRAGDRRPLRGRPAQETQNAIEELEKYEAAGAEAQRRKEHEQRRKRERQEEHERWRQQGLGREQHPAFLRAAALFRDNCPASLNTRALASGLRRGPDALGSPRAFQELMMRWFQSQPYEVKKEFLQEMQESGMGMSRQRAATQREDLRAETLVEEADTVAGRLAKRRRRG